MNFNLVKSFDLEENFKGQEKKIAYLLDETQINQKLFNTILDRSDENDELRSLVNFDIEGKKKYFQQVRKYLQEIQTNNFILKRTYYLSDCGRYYTKTNSLQYLSNELRGFLCSGVMTDIDISNSQPSIILMLCNKYNIPCNNLRNYVENRTKLIDKINKTSKKQVSKMDFIICMNRQEKTKSKIPEIIVFDDEIKEIQQAFLTIDDFQEIKKKISDDKQSNFAGCFLNNVYFHYESLINQELRRVLTIKNVKICSYQFDGNLIYGNYYDNHFDWKDEIVSEIIDKLDFLDDEYFKLTFKEHKNCVSMPEEYEIPTIYSIDSIEDKTLLDNFSHNYFHSLPSYEQRKIYFEHFIIKIWFPQPMFVMKSAFDKNIGNEDYFFSEASLQTLFKNLKSGEVSKNGEEVKFLTKWLVDSENIGKHKMDFLPFNEKNIDALPNPYIYNLFKGFNPMTKTDISHLSEEQQQKVLEPFFVLWTELCGGEKEYWQYVEKYMAHTIQHPEERSRIAIIIKSQQGVGKNVGLNAFGNLLGSKHFISSSNPKDFFGEYAEGFYNKLCVNLNECEAKDTFDFEGKIKSFITEEKIVLNRKYICPIEVKNLARVFIFSNKEAPIQIDVRSKDRRFVVFESTNKFLDPKYNNNYWSKMNEYFKKPEFISCLYHHLNKIDLKNVNWINDRPITEAYKKMVKLFLPLEVLFLENYLKRIDDDVLNYEDSPSGSSFYETYIAFCKKYGFNREGAFQKNIKSFYSALNSLKINSLYSKQLKGITTFCLEENKQDILNDMKYKKWIDRDENEEEVEQDVVSDDSWKAEFNFDII